MPKWYRLNSSGTWAPLKVYRLNTGGTWAQMKKIYRLYADGEWRLVHSSAQVPTVTTSPTLTNQVSSSDYFYGGDILTLTRGAYTNTTNDSDTTYRMRIYKGLNPSLTVNATNWTVLKEQTYTGATSTASTSISTGSLDLVDLDAFDQYYYVGEVTVNNDANTVGSETYDFVTSPKVLSRVSLSANTLDVTGETENDAYITWAVSGISSNGYIYSQQLIIRETSPSGTIIKNVSLGITDRSYTLTNDPALSPSTLYYVEIQVIANDGWKLTATPTKSIDSTYFSTLAAPPVNISAPTISPLNNRGYLPVSTTLTADKGTWTNVNAFTTYSYDWWLEDAVSGAVTNTGYIGNTRTYSLSDVGNYLFVRAKATNSDGNFGTAVSNTYILDQAVAVGTITPTSTNQSTSTNFSFSISHYPTSYTINWGDGTSDYSSGSISANTSTVSANVAHTYSTAGTYTITVTAQPGNKTNTASVTVSAPITISFNANGGTLSSGPGNGLTTYDYSGNVGSTFTAPSATRSGYTFSTWRYPLSGGDPYFLTPGTNYTFGSLGLESSRTYWAIWTAANLTAPTISFVSAPSSPGGPLSVYFSGGSGPYYQIWWQASNNFSSVTGYDANGSSSPVTDSTGPSAGTWYVAVRSVSALTNTGSGPSSTISSWSSPVQFTVSAGTPPSTPTNGTGTFSTGTNYITNATFTGSSSGTTPITYYWTVASSTSSSGPWSTRNSGSISASSLGGTQIIPQQSWNQSSFGSWARYQVYASNLAGSSGTLTWII